jgi:transketolase
MSKELSHDQIKNLKEMARVIRGLAMDGVQAANSGHPGMPMGMADAASLLWMEHLKHNPKDSGWIDRDRFVLSAGHGSMLLYSLLHLTGYNLPLEELKHFRQLNSKTPGHPEYRHTDGVETTTGPLGQGLANAVGMAVAEKKLASRYNKADSVIIDHYTYVIAGDGCMQEGISHEACSLAGHLKLNKLIVFYDDNSISIDGPTSLSFSEDVLKRFDAYGWHTQRIDGHNLQEVNKAIYAAKADNRPSIIACKTIIGYGSPNKAGTESAHGSPLGPDEVTLTKEKLGLPKDTPFFISDEALKFARSAVEKGQEARQKWNEGFKLYASKYKDEAAEFSRITSGKLPENWEKALPVFSEETMATRTASGKTLDAILPQLPELLGGSADLTPSNNTYSKNASTVLNAANYSGNYIHYGVREHATAGIMNGIALHGGFIPYAGTFLVFSDYMRNSVRLSALMGIKVVFVFTHDSIGLGEDGPTHQPVEHIASLREIPNLTVIRPADANETAQAWKTALTNESGPTALILTRQNLSIVTDNKTSSNLAKGAYTISDAANAKAVIIATGSEVEIALSAQKILTEKGIASKVISMPSTELFDKQDEQYKKNILPDNLKYVAVEAGTPSSWYKYVGKNGKVIGMKGYGASGKYKDLYTHFGITAQAVADAVTSII